MNLEPLEFEPEDIATGRLELILIRNGSPVISWPIQGEDGQQLRPGDIAEVTVRIRILDPAAN